MISTMNNKKKIGITTSRIPTIIRKMDITMKKGEMMRERELINKSRQMLLSWLRRRGRRSYRNMRSWRCRPSRASSINSFRRVHKQ